VVVVVAAMVETIASWLVRGRPRQFIEMCENKRCSREALLKVPLWGILFHLDVPGGR